MSTPTVPSKAEGDRKERTAAGARDTGQQPRKRARKACVAEMTNSPAAVASHDVSVRAPAPPANDGQHLRHAQLMDASLKARAGAQTRMGDLDRDNNDRGPGHHPAQHQLDQVQPSSPRVDSGGTCSPPRDHSQFGKHASGQEVVMDDGTDSDSFRDSSEREPHDPTTAAHSTTPFASDAATRPSGPRASKWRVLSSQKKVLLDAFAAQPYPSPSEKEVLANTVGVTVTQLAKWFQHRREALGRAGKFQVLFNRARRSAAESNVLQSECITRF
jgi:hypothetical protein